MTKDVSLDTRGWNALMSALEGVDKHAVKVGILEARGGADQVGDSGMTLASIGAIHEFGTMYATNADGEPLIPARHWLSGTFYSYADELREMQKKIAKAMFAGKIDGKQAMGMLGVWAANKVKYYVKNDNDIEPPLADSTYERKLAKTRPGSKGDPRVLVDTGLMINSVNYEIDTNPETPVKLQRVVGDFGR